MEFKFENIFYGRLILVNYSSITSQYESGEYFGSWRFENGAENC